MSENNEFQTTVSLPLVSALGGTKGMTHAFRGGNQNKTSEDGMKSLLALQDVDIPFHRSQESLLSVLNSAIEIARSCEDNC
mmetsp:Transcript_16605/g.23404  ORF Transcript_16605/g.23404 Transcript_16605/m.23404 type:complete len:81 (-) Transcript_16605:303-545(-)